MNCAGTPNLGAKFTEILCCVYDEKMRIFTMFLSGLVSSPDPKKLAGLSFNQNRGDLRLTLSLIVTAIVEVIEEESGTMIICLKNLSRRKALVKTVCPSCPQPLA